MDIYKNFHEQVLATINAIWPNEPKLKELTHFQVEQPREAKFGDISTNAALIVGKKLSLSPMAVAALLQPHIANFPEVAEAHVAAPGFINCRLHEKVWQQTLNDILKLGIDYGNSQIGHGQRVNVEYVSANPTGPLHLGHARGAVVGDALAALLAKAGYHVTKEYYINDAGAQVDVLANSTYLRYQEALGIDIGQIPEGYYPGDYLKEVAAAIIEKDGNKWLKSEPHKWLPFFRQFAVHFLMETIKADLAALDIHHDIFSSEKALIDQGGVERMMKELEKRGHIYNGILEAPKGSKASEDWEPRPQMLFRATAFGDDVDRPLQKSDGSWTYFATDIAYQYSKFTRGDTLLINVWGADHAGYIKRLQAAVAAVTDKQGQLVARICQMVRLSRNGQPVKMSKRAGSFVTLKEVVDEVGRDVVRFTMLTRKNDAPLDFDLMKVIEKSRDNPVFYVQYAHARACSITRRVQSEPPHWKISHSDLLKADKTLLSDEAEIALIKLMGTWPKVVEAAALAQEPHRIAYYLYEVANLFHVLYTKGKAKDESTLRFIIPDQPDVTYARLALVQSLANVISCGLKIMGVEPATEMTS